jgi:hypothetical protein
MAWRSDGSSPSERLVKGQRACIATSEEPGRLVLGRGV